MMKLVFTLAGVFFLIGCTAVSQEQSKAILVFSKTEKFRHTSIEDGIKAFELIADDLNYEIVTTEEANYFNPDSLSKYQVVVFLNTTGDVLNARQQESFENYIRNGGGFMGIHAAADTEYNWAWYGKLVGAWFAGHPNNPNVRRAVVRKNIEHFITNDMPVEWKRQDEWYNYKQVYPEINVLLKLDESSYEGGTMGENHPITWFHEYDGGRAFYTGMGHTSETYKDPLFLGMIIYALQYVSGEK